MRGELPVCRRCCFCLPLRYGLIAWGYIRLVIAIIFFLGTLSTVYGILVMALWYAQTVGFIFFILLFAFLILLSLTDIVLNIVFVIGGHKKNLKLLRAYYIYTVILSVLTTLMAIASVIYTLFLFKWGQIDYSFHIWIILVDSATMLAQILIQFYVILLVRSEIIKLRSNCQFRFVNNAAEAECSMKCEEESRNEEDTCEKQIYSPDTYQ